MKSICPAIPIQKCGRFVGVASSPSALHVLFLPHTPLLHSGRVGAAGRGGWWGGLLRVSAARGGLFAAGGPVVGGVVRPPVSLFFASSAAVVPFVVFVSVVGYLCA